MPLIDNIRKANAARQANIAKRRKNPFIEEFRAYLVINRAPATVQKYTSTTYNFADYLKAAGNRTLRQAKAADILGWFGKLNDRVGKARMAEMRAGLHLFYDWMIDIKGLKAHPFPRLLGKFQIDHTSITRPVPTAEQFLMLRHALNEHVKAKPEAQPRHELRCQIELMAGTGIREGVFMELRPSHVDWSSGYIMLDDSLPNKRGHEYQPRCTPYALVVLQRYLERWPVPKHERLWTTNKGKFDKHLRTFLKGWPDWTAHAFRYLYGCMNYFRSLEFREGQPPSRHDIVFVRDMLGHASLATTDRYVRLARRLCESDEMWEAWALGKIVPIEKLKQTRGIMPQVELEGVA